MNFFVHTRIRPIYISAINFTDSGNLDIKRFPDLCEKMPPPDIPPKGTDNSGAKPQLTNQERMNIEREQEQKLKESGPI